MSPKDYIGIAARYQAEVLSGEIPACKWVKLACERNRRDLDHQETAAFPYRFDADAGRRICQMAEMLPHVKGPKAFIVGRDADDRPIWNALVLEPWQCWILTTLFGWKRVDNGLRRFRVSLCLIPRKNAKALALDTQIPTPDGLRAMGDIAVGDSVFGPDGKPTRVVAATPVMIGRPCYRVVFSDGSEFTADADHLWRVYDRWRAREVVERTEVMASRVHIGSRGTHREHRYRVPVAAPLEMPERAFLVDPYVLGAWLGDGNTATTRLTTADPEIAQHCIAVGESARAMVTRGNGKAVCYALNDGSRRNRSESLQVRMRQLGVLGRKHIPEGYQIGSIAQRWSLLQGLMDTDGTVAYSGRRRVPICTFTSTCEALAHGVHRLVACLGLKPTIRESRAKLEGKDCGPVWHVAFTAFGDGPVFRLERKQGRLLSRPAASTRSMNRTIVSIYPVPSVPVRCIQVEREDGMYVAGQACVQTHNSTLAAVVVLYMMVADGESGAECYSAATTRDQAKAIAEIAWEMAKRSPAFREHFGVRMGSETTRSLAVPANGSKFAPLSADAHTLDSLNVSLAAIDELHAHKTAAVWNVLDTATGARLQPMLFAITTAGVDIGGVCHAKLGYLEKILDGVFQDEAFFGINYTIDQGDDIKLEVIQRKANPNFGISVDPDDLQRKVHAALQSQSDTNNLLTKHFNVWIRNEASWMGGTLWQTCGKPDLTLEYLKQFPCWIGVDLAEVRDIAALMALFKLGKDEYAAIGRFYLPAAAVDKSPIAQLPGWVRQGFIIETDGDQADFARIEADILHWCATLQVKEIDFDRALAAHMQQELKRQLEPKMGRDAVDKFVVTVKQNVENMDSAMKMTERLVLGKQLQHDGNPAMAWMVSNVVIERNYKDEIYPRKAGGKDSPNKIDGPVAFFTALSQAMQEQERTPDYSLMVFGGGKRR